MNYFYLQMFKSDLMNVVSFLFKQKLCPNKNRFQLNKRSYIGSWKRPLKCFFFFLFLYTFLFLYFYFLVKKLSPFFDTSSVWGLIGGKRVSPLFPFCHNLHEDSSNIFTYFCHFTFHSLK